MVLRRVRVLTRGSPLALAQAEECIAAIRTVMPAGTEFEVRTRQTPGDRDKQTLLGGPDVPDDFFSRDLDQALLAGEGDLAVHSAKDLPRTMPVGLRLACLLPAREDRDALVLRTGVSRARVRRIGASSPRRESAIRALFAGAIAVPIRGTIQERLAQLEADGYDAVIVAACALERLGLAHRIDAYLPWETAPLQGHLAVVARAEDVEWGGRLRPLDFRMHLFDTTSGATPEDNHRTSEFQAPSFKHQPSPIPHPPSTIDHPPSYLPRALNPGRSGAMLFLGTDPARFERYGPLIPWPMIRLEPVDRATRIAALTEEMPGCDGILFASPFAVRVFADAVFHGPGPEILEGRRMLAVGPSTAEAMERLYLRADATGTGFDGLRGLAGALPAGGGSALFYPCSRAAPAGDRVEILRRVGLRLRPHVFYENRTNTPGPLPTDFDRVLFTSPSTVAAFFSCYPEQVSTPFRWLAIGPSTLAALRERGLKGELLHED